MLIAAVALAALSGCVPHTPPHPVPTPTVAPPPLPGPLEAQEDGTWTRDGKPWPMRMAIVCCKGSPDSDPSDLAKSQNWPLTSPEFLQWISSHKQNATEIRPFMCPQHEGGAFFSPYRVATPDLKVDLNAWNPEFWAYVDNLLTEAERRGVIVMVGVIDTWPQDHGLSPWCGSCNVSGVNYCDDTVLRGNPPEIALKFARKVYEETGRHKNVIYQDGNESFEAMSANWTLGLQALLRNVEAEKGYVRHPFGTQQRDDGLRDQVDFVTDERDSAVSKWCWGERCKPTIVNESALRTPAEVLRQVYRADTLGSSFAFWMGDLNQDQRGQTLIALEGWANGQPIPDWARMADECPKVAGIDAKVHQHVCNNQTWPEACAGGSTVIDATPLFGRTGPRGVCNDEHDNCGGRICEPGGLTWTWEAPPGVRCFVQNFAHCEDDTCGVPCTPGQGYQLKCENERPGHYRAQPHINGQTDCYGKPLRPATDGTAVEWDVP